MKTLEIIIPTYGRPESASSTINSALECIDPRFRVRCNSNGVEPSLEKYRASGPKIIYSCFDNNLGVHENFRHLLRLTDAKFCMLLSDEDRIEANNLPDFLNFLDRLDAKTKVISCSIFDEERGNYYHMPPPESEGVEFDGDLFAALDLVPSYISGLVFSVAALQKLNLDELYFPSPGNAYPHLDLSQLLLISGVLRYYLPRLVIKGKEVRHGGDGFSHIIKNVQEAGSNRGLNPKVYGPYARARQFYYRNRMYRELRSKLTWKAYALANLLLMQKFLEAVWRSPSVVILPTNIKIRDETKKAYLDYRKENAYRNSFGAQIFRFAVNLPNRAHRSVLLALGLLRKVLRRLYRI